MLFKMKGVLHVTSALFAIWLFLNNAEGVYQPECNSFDQVIQSIEQSFGAIQDLPGLALANINCTRNTECDGFTCLLSIQNHKTEITMELKACDDPPQMFILMRDVDTDQTFVEQTVSHGDVYTIPGLEYSYAGLVLVQADLQVEFEKVPSGIRLGLQIAFIVGDQTFQTIPLLPPTVIQVPPCPSPGGDTLQCTHMQTLVDSLQPPHDFQCQKNPDCRGFNCAGFIDTLGSRLSAEAKLVIESCSNPVSFIMGVGAPDAPPQATHVFTHSENIQLEGVSLPTGVTGNLSVTMEPYSLDIDYIRTSIKLILCFPWPTCITDVFIDQALVPIPPCDNPMPTATSGHNDVTSPKAGDTDECTTMQDIANDITHNENFAPGSLMCHANEACDGLDCNINHKAGQFVISVRLYHCEDPARLHVIIDKPGTDYHVEQDVYHDQELPIDPIIQGARLKLHVFKRLPNTVELAMSVGIPTSSNDSLSYFYLIQERLIPVASCGMHSTAAMTTSVKTTVTKNTDKPNSGPGSKTTQDPENGNKNKGPSANKKSNSASVGVGIGVAAFVALVLIILAGVWFVRHRRTPSDQITLMEHTSAAI